MKITFVQEDKEKAEFDGFAGDGVARLKEVYGV